MKKPFHEKSRKRRILIIIPLLILTLLLTAFAIYTSDYYHADETAIDILEEGLNNKSIVEEPKWLALPAEENAETKTGFIFYPGAKVEYISYLPLMEKLRQDGINCYLVEMPFNLAILGSNRAEDIIEAHPEITTWYIGGHSLGGAFASSYASQNQDKIEGVILLGAYLYGDYPEEQSLTIYGSEDFVLSRDKLTYETNVIELEGGNHAQFGSYGEQEGDGEANITSDFQQEQTAVLIAEMILP